MCLEILWHKKKTLLWIGASLRLYTDVFEDLIIFGTILYVLCLLYLFHATLIYSYMLYTFDHLIHKSSDALYYRSFILSGQTVPFFFILIIVFFFLILLYYLFFALVLNTVDIALVKFSF